MAAWQMHDGGERLAAVMDEIGGHEALAASGNDALAEDRLRMIDDRLDCWSAELAATRDGCRNALARAGHLIVAKSWPSAVGVCDSGARTSETGLLRLAACVHDAVGDIPPPFDLAKCARCIVEELRLEAEEADTAWGRVWDLGAGQASGEEALVVAACGWELPHIRRLGRAIAETGDCVASVAAALQEALGDIELDLAARNATWQMKMAPRRHPFPIYDRKKTVEHRWDEDDGLEDIPFHELDAAFWQGLQTGVWPEEDSQPSLWGKGVVASYDPLYDPSDEDDELQAALLFGLETGFGWPDD